MNAKEIGVVDMSNILIARQPVFDSKLNVFGYEISCCGQQPDEGSRPESEITSTALLNTFLTIGLDNLTHDKPAFIPFNRGFINEEIPDLFPSNYLVVDIRQDLNIDLELIGRCQELKDQGYVIALDSRLLNGPSADLLGSASLIRLDAQKIGLPGIRLVAQQYLKPGIRLLAENIYDQETFEFAKKSGCTLFQGPYFGKPAIREGQSPESLNTSHFDLLGAVGNSHMDFGEISKMILQDMTLTYYLLRLVNAPAFGLTNRVTSIRQALAILGEKEIRKWVALIMLSIVCKDKPDELIRSSLLRARLAEQIAYAAGLEGNLENYFLAGLFSKLDVIIGKSFDEISSEIFLPAPVRRYLLGQADDKISPLMELVEAYDLGDWQQVVINAQKTGVSQEILVDAYKCTLKWIYDLQVT